MPQHKVFSTKFPTSSLEEQGERVELVPGEYEVVAKYFIRVTTPKHSRQRIDAGPMIRLRDHGARMWAGKHLKSNTLRFTVKAEDRPKK